MNERAFNALEESATKHNVSLNTFVNQMFLSYADYERFLDKLHPFRQPSAVFKLIIEAVPEDKIAAIGKSVGESIYNKQLVLEMTGKLSQEGVIQFLKSIADHESLEYSDVEHDGRRTVTFIHNLGRNYSIFAANFVKAILDSLGCDPIKYTYGDESVMFDFFP